VVGDCLSCFTVSQSFSLSGRETSVGAFLIVDHFPSPSASTRRVFRWLLPRAGLLTGEIFNPTFFFGAAGIAGEPKRAAHRCSQRL
jgi:hypothetical protein